MSNETKSTKTETAPAPMFQAIYWATAKGHQIANFRPEKKEHGQIIHAEVPLKFQNHILITEDPKVMKFVENSSSFKNGRVKRVADLKEAMALTAKEKQARQIRTVESSFIDEGNKVYTL